MLRDCLKARGRVGSRQDGICGAIAFLHQVEDLLLDAQRLLGRHHLAVAVRGMGSSHHDLQILDELIDPALDAFDGDAFERSEEHTSELQAQMRKSYDVFCLEKKITNVIYINIYININLSSYK